MENEDIMPTEIAGSGHRLFNKGEMGLMISKFDWGPSALGPLESWNHILVNYINLMLDCSFPMLIWWGEEKIQLYNDACKKTLFGGRESKHPVALGQPASLCWPEAWPTIEENLALLENTDTSFFEEDKLIPIYRNGHLQEVYWTYSYSKLRDDQGKQAGILIIVKETTRANRLLHREESAQRFYLQLADRLRASDNMDEMVKETLELLGRFLHVDRAGFAKVYQRRDEVAIKPNFIQHSTQPIEGIQRASILGENYLCRLEKGTLFSDTYQEEFYLEKVLHKENISSANMPLLQDGFLKAVVFLHRKNETAWSKWELSIIKQSCERLWDAMARVKAVTELRLSEHRYRALFDSIDEAFMVLEFAFDRHKNPVDYRFIQVNPAFELQSGLRNVVGKYILEIMPDIEPVWIQTYGEVAKSGKSHRFEQYNDGTGRWYRVYAASVGNETKQVVVVFSDITESKLEEQRKNDFLSIASHELKTPLTSIHGYMQLLRKKLRSQETAVYIDMVERTAKQIDRMTAIINGFLNIAQWDRKGVSLNKEHFDITSLVAEVFDETSSNVSSHRILLKSSNKLLVHADRYKILQVIQNFVSNALKYSPKGSEVELACDNDNDMVRITVTDKGLGISQEHQRHIFDRFYRVENQSTQGVSGFGIGLYLCAEIIKKHDGQIGVISEPGMGACFWFTLRPSE